MSGPLSGYRVIDLAGELGVYCTKLLADAGADVVRIEPPAGDPLRRRGPYFQGRADPSYSLYYWYMNTNKRSLTLNLESRAGREVFLRLASRADVVVETFQPGYMERLGLGWEVLRDRNPSLVLTSITPFGQTGPYRALNACDLVCMAMGGLMYLGGYPDTEPLAAFGQQACIAASLHAAVATVIALYDRERSGIGQWIDVSAQEAVAHSIENAAQYYDLEGVVRRRTGSEQPEAGSGLYPCRDGYVYLVASMRGALLHWDALVGWLLEEGCDEAKVLLQPEWREAEFRCTEKARAAFDSIIRSFTLPRTKMELYEGGQKRGVAICPVSTPADLWHNPQLGARGYFRTLSHELLGIAVPYPGPPYRFSITECGPSRPAPVPGQDTLTVLAELGYTQAEIESLVAEGVV